MKSKLNKPFFYYSAAYIIKYILYMSMFNIQNNLSRINKNKHSNIKDLTIYYGNCIDGQYETIYILSKYLLGIA